MIMDDLQRLLLSRQSAVAPSPPLPRGRLEGGAGEDEGPSLDDWGVTLVVSLPGEQPSAAARASAPVALFITYLDAKGRGSERRITLHGVDRTDADRVVVKAYCHLRKMARNFRLDRIVESVDVVTGEVYDPPHAFLDLVGLGLQEDTTLQAVAAARLGLTVLAFLSRCDGKQDDSEMAVMLDYLSSQADRADWDVDRAVRLLTLLYPDPAGYGVAISALASGLNGEELSRVARYARRLVDADGVLHPEEARFALALDHALKDVS
jgi:hypothetical protein